MTRREKRRRKELTPVIDHGITACILVGDLDVVGDRLESRGKVSGHLEDGMK